MLNEGVKWLNGVRAVKGVGRVMGVKEEEGN